MSGRDGKAARRTGVFDAFDLSSRRAGFGGTVDAAALPRVADRLAEDAEAADVSWRIDGTEDALGRPALEVSLHGSVPLVCQRCLEAFSWPIEQRTTLLLARDERTLTVLDEDDEHEVLLVAAPLDSLELVEDELLLTLPIAPRCARERCAMATDVASESDASAFAVLAGLKAMTAKRTKD